MSGIAIAIGSTVFVLLLLAGTAAADLGRIICPFAPGPVGKEWNAVANECAIKDGDWCSPEVGFWTYTCGIA